MGPIRSSLGGGIAATFILLVLLLIIDVLLPGTHAIATFTGLCAIIGPPYCELGSPTATFMTYFWFGLLFAVAWPLVFGAVTWGLPGKSGLSHGVVFGLILWLGYAAGVLFEIGVGDQTFAESLPVLVVTLFVYLIYGIVLGGGYDYLAGHRTFLSEDPIL